ncbi:GSCFA domain-containing protein [Simiduia agarivorans]|uniref:GSCFA domain-containing protein n=1 Tax=Simiduia agarivorans (strain DSM 21679 / JCM 13881 / BCRC 17597 / SA1) TaxID=1117647 RepID=K4KIG2_SIMAS|nr:GSCFA domain-containing protein [Simiduia agarivorans]AFU97748.2 GSCFA domain-containing protein [Simiduia agarivorans SA1 = DSM 21679]
MNSKQALQVAFKNRAKRWVPVVEKEKNNPLVAMNRFKTGEYFFVDSSPSFKIGSDSSVYTVGSCFARNVERSLLECGVDLIGQDFSIDSNYLLESVGFMGNQVNNRSALNKYSTFSICEEFERVLLHKEVLDSGFIRISEDGWIDPQLASVLRPLPFSELLKVRQSVDSLVGEVVKADVIFITLGLNEVWFDNHTKTYLNSSPPPSLLRSDDSRFTFAAPDIIEVYEKLSSTVDLISRMSEKDPKFVVTVSPVPMSTTWTSSDVVVANTISKSSLRVCAEKLTNDFGNVDYFPSFEMVLNSPRALAWGDDELHVRPQMVDFVIGNFVERYVDQ